MDKKCKVSECQPGSRFAIRPPTPSALPPPPLQSVPYQLLDSEEMPLAELKASNQSDSTSRSDLSNEDNWLSKILSLSIDPSVHVRLKAFGYLTSIVDGNPSALDRQDIQLWVRNALLDQSRQVREAAVNLIGKHMWNCAGLLDKHCEILSARILDVGVGVRKRAIRALRDICLNCPDFPKVPELCVKIVKRVNDEEIMVRKLVVDTFQEMWFPPSNKVSEKQLRQKATHLIGAVEASTTDKLATECLELLLEKILNPNHDLDMKDNQKSAQALQTLLSAAEQVVDYVVDEALRAEEARLATYFISCVSTLLLFAKSCPKLLLKHVSVLQEYLTWKCHGTEDVLAVTQVAKILALVVPPLRHPSESQLAQPEAGTPAPALQFPS